MANTGNRPVLRLKGQEIVPPEEDRTIEIGIYDILLPCRKYEISYKVAVLGKVSPSLEFLLRLLKCAPGITEEDAAAFFGYTRDEVAYVLNEALGPGYIERKEGRLWLTTAGDALFRDDDDDPTIFQVEDRRRAIGFDLLAIAPQQPQPLDFVEQWLPELPIEDGASTGRAAEKIGERFGRFFHELVDRSDREQLQRRDLYSIDSVVPKDRFQALVRMKVFAQASSPSVPEIDLNAWRPGHEIADRPQVEHSAALLVDDLKVTSAALNASDAYAALVQLAPEFLKEFTTRTGLAVNRYWREAVGRVGEARSDRPTIAIVGPLYTEGNARRVLEVLDYGLRDKTDAPGFIMSVAPQTRFWGATTLQRDTLALIKRKLVQQPAADAPDPRSICLVAGKPPRYLERSFDEVHCSDAPEFPGALELLLFPNTAVAAMVHSPIGATSGQPVALGLASFDAQVVSRAQSFIVDRLARFIVDDAKLKQFADALDNSD